MNHNATTAPHAGAASQQAANASPTDLLTDLFNVIGAELATVQASLSLLATADADIDTSVRNAIWGQHNTIERLQNTMEQIWKAYNAMKDSGLMTNHQRKSQPGPLSIEQAVEQFGETYPGTAVVSRRRLEGATQIVFACMELPDQDWDQTEALRLAWDALVESTKPELIGE